MQEQGTGHLPGRCERDDLLFFGVYGEDHWTLECCVRKKVGQERERERKMRKCNNSVKDVCDKEGLQMLKKESI